MATVRNTGPVAVTPVGLLAKSWIGLWPLSAMLVAPKLLERKWLWMETRSTTTMMAICYAFRRLSGSMHNRHCDVLHGKDVHEEKRQDHYQYNAGEVFPELTRTSIATDRFVLLSRLPALSHDIANLSFQENCTVLQMVLLYKS